MKPPQIFKPEDFTKFTKANCSVAEQAQAIFEKWYLENVVEQLVSTNEIAGLDKVATCVYCFRSFQSHAERIAHLPQCELSYPREDDGA